MRPALLLLLVASRGAVAAPPPEAPPPLVLEALDLDRPDHRRPRPPLDEGTRHTWTFFYSWPLGAPLAPSDLEVDPGGEGDGEEALVPRRLPDPDRPLLPRGGEARRGGDLHVQAARRRRGDGRERGARSRSRRPAELTALNRGRSPRGAPYRQEEETLRRVTLTRAFRISATEVTQRQWRALMPRNPSAQPGDDHSVTAVSWKEAQEFCLELSRKEGASYRLPTEAEWEYACRAGGGDPAEAGELRTVAWYADNSDGTTHPVGTKAANAWGLYDMIGNVAEWTLDAYAPYPRVEEEKDPTGPETGTTRAVRGGAWRSFPPALRCAARTGVGESYQLSHVGFRVVEERRVR